MAIVAHKTQLGSYVINHAFAAGTAVTVYASVGTGAGTAAVTDTAMSAEDTTTGRHACTVALATTSFANDSITATLATLTIGVASETVTEFGLWDAATGGNLIMHATGFSILCGSGTGTPTIGIAATIQDQPQ